MTTSRRVVFGKGNLSKDDAWVEFQKLYPDLSLLAKNSGGTDQMDAFTHALAAPTLSLSSIENTRTKQPKLWRGYRNCDVCTRWRPVSDFTVSSSAPATSRSRGSVNTVSAGWNASAMTS